MTISTTVTDAEQAVREIRSACGILAILSIDGNLNDRELGAGLKHILLHLEAIEEAQAAAAAAPMRFTELPILTLADVARGARGADVVRGARGADVAHGARRPSLKVVEGGAA